MEGNIMILGERGVGKSTIANEFFELSSQGGGRFPEAGSTDRALGCQLFHGQTGATKGASVVEVTGFFGEGVSSTRIIWPSIVNAFESLQRRVNVFILILDMRHHEKNEQIVQAFVNYFGDIGALNAMVLFTNHTYPEPEVAEHYAMYHNHGFLQKVLGPMFKYQILPKFSEDSREKIPRDEILRKMKVLCQLSGYDIRQFKPALRRDLMRWAREKKSRNERIYITQRAAAGDEITEVPDLITQRDRFFSEAEITQIITEIKVICEPVLKRPDKIGVW